MSIPLATTTIAVLRVPADPTRDDMDAPGAASYVPVASKVRAAISSPSGNTQSANGTRSEMTFRLGCDPVPVGISYLDRVKDEQTGIVYQVIWATPRTGLGVDHIEGDLRLVVGES